MDVAPRAADERGRQELAEAFTALGGLAEDTAAALVAIQQQLAEQGRAHRVQTDLPGCARSRCRPPATTAA